MSKSIYTYADIKSINNNPFIEQISQYPIITVSSDFRKVLSSQVFEHLEGENSVDFWGITDFMTIARVIDSKWNTEQTKFYEIVVISEYLSKKIEQCKCDEEKKWLIGCRRNIGYIQSAIALLEQAELSPEDLDSDYDENIKLFIEIWGDLRTKDPLLEKYRNRMNTLSDRECLDNVLNTAFKCEKNIKDCKAVVFWGFYYFTPYQKRVMNMLEKVGYDLIFYFSYNEKYPFLYEIWNKTYSEEKGFPSKDSWHIEDCKNEDVYGELFENGKILPMNNSLKINEYSSVMEFINDVKRIKEEKFSICSANHKWANEILKDFYPDEYGTRKLLAYPVGTFINTIVNLWDDNKKEVVLDEDSLIECFSSGWLSYKGVSSRRYLEDLMRVIPFFSNCSTIEEWTKRMDDLKEINKELSDTLFESGNSDCTVDRWQKYMSNPLSYFSMFSLEEDRLNAVISLMIQLLDIAKELFSGQEQINIDAYMQKLTNTLKKCEVSDGLYDEELKIVIDIFEKINTGNTYAKKCYPWDIVRALNLYFSGRINDDEIQIDQKEIVQPIYSIDSTSMNATKIHICICDVKSMPGNNKDYVWPLTKELMKKCLDKTNNLLINDIIDIMSSTIEMNRYFMYRALKAENVELSWIREIDEKLLEPSPYIKLLKESFNIDIEPKSYQRLSPLDISKMSYGEYKIAEYDKSVYLEKSVPEARMSYSLCPIQYVFNYVVDSHPVFISNYQQSYAINALICAIYNLLNKDTSLDEVYDNVIVLFPNLKKAEKRQIRDYVERYLKNKKTKNTDRTEYKQKYYTDERQSILYPYSDLLRLVNHRFAKLATPDGREGMDLYEEMHFMGGEEIVRHRKGLKAACPFCPHIDYCRKAIYVVDQEVYFDN